jgi:glycosyltransferase involved in cell wall biosynthesis
MITYGHDEFIEEAINGILSQETNFEIELIVADDCSPDNTQAVVQEVIRKNENGHWIKYTRHAKNKGVMGNFQWALGQCKGKYIAVCEGDDYWIDTKKLQKQVDYLERNPEQIFCYHRSKVLDFDKQIKQDERDNQMRIIPSDKVISTYIQLLTMVFRNELEEFLAIDFGKLFSGDVALRAYLSTLGSGTFLPFEGAVYRKHVNGIRSGTGEVENYEKWIESRMIVLGKITGVNKTDLFDSIIKIQKRKTIHLIKRRNLGSAFLSFAGLVYFKLKKYIR